MSFQRILIEDNGRFGLVWTAAFRPNKLTKVDVLHIDISQKCREILEFVDVDTSRRGPARPRFSLFISSHLMKGLCVLLQKKNNYIYEDAMYARSLLHPHRVPVVDFEPVVGKSPTKRLRKLNQLDTSMARSTTKQIAFGENLPPLIDTDAPFDRFVVENESMMGGVMITLPDMIETRLIPVEMEQEDLVPMDVNMLDSMMMMFPEHNAEVTLQQEESKETGRVTRQSMAAARQSLTVRFDMSSLLEQPSIVDEIQQPPVLFQDTFMDVAGDTTMLPVPEIQEPQLPQEETIPEQVGEQEATITRARARRVARPHRLIIDQALEITQEEMASRIRRSHRLEIEERMDEFRRDHRLKCQHDFLTTNPLAFPLSRGIRAESKMSKYLPEYMIAQWGAEARRETRQRRREVAAASRLEAPAELGATLPSDSISMAREQGREMSAIESEAMQQQQTVIGMDSVSRLRGEAIAPMPEISELQAPMDMMMDLQPPPFEQTLPEERIEPHIAEVVATEQAPTEPDVDFERIILNALEDQDGQIILQYLCQTHQLPDKCKKKAKPRRDFYTRMFAATLELCKSKKITAQQTNFYGPITLEL